MELLTQEQINDIRKSVDIVDIISNYVSLTAHGKNYFGICPFHNDNNPSMSVSKEKQIYKCFSCGERGNVFTFIQKYENISFLEAVRIVALKSGIEININIQDKQIEKNKELYDIYKLSLKLYQNNINTKHGLEAKEYLKQRQIDDEIIKQFEIGLAIKDRTLLTSLLVNKNYTYENMLKSGLIIKNEYGYSDIYCNRIMFPLYDTVGKIVGYSGRIYNEKNNSKYINTKETEIFKKGELLYNYHRAKDQARITDTIIIMEGFLDVIRVYSIGITNCVATMGTAVTKNQAILIKRLAKNVILCFDGDEAGIKATESCSKELINIGIIPKVVCLEEELDPDEYILKYGEKVFKQKIDNPITITEFKLSYYKKNKNLNQVEDKAQYINEIIKSLNEINDDILREITLTKISEESKIDIELLKSKLNAKITFIPKKVPNKIKLNKYQKAEMYLLYYMINNQEVIKIYNHKVKYLPTEKYRILARSITQFYKENNCISEADLISSFNNNELIDSLKEISNLELKDTYTLEEINDYIDVISEYNIKEELIRLNEELKKEIDSERQSEILEKIVELRGDNND
ncbi:MAG: DNA primase [Bacilli bacterium]